MTKQRTMRRRSEKGSGEWIEKKKLIIIIIIITVMLRRDG